MFEPLELSSVIKDTSREFLVVPFPTSVKAFEKNRTPWKKIHGGEKTKKKIKLEKKFQKPKS